jgi:hypothetical protein
MGWAPLLQDEKWWRRIGGRSDGGQGFDRRERSVGKERKGIGDFGRGRGDWVVPHWGEVEAWTKGLNAKLPTGGVNVHSFMDFSPGQTAC